MKKLTLTLMILLFAAGFITAENFDLGKFPKGTWIDNNFDAVWELSVDNIRILNTGGGVYYDFSKATVPDFKVDADMKGVTISFSCNETGKTYKLYKPVSTGTSITLEIDPPWGEHYKVEMPFRK